MLDSEFLTCVYLFSKNRKFSQGKVNATAGGKQSLVPKVVEMIKNLESTK